jgi:hypothetical protein
MLAGCITVKIGKPFDRIGNDRLVLRQTTIDDVAAVLGPTNSQTTMNKSGREVYVITYTQASSKSETGGLGSGKVQSFYFYEGRLVGHVFNSTYLASQTSKPDKRKIPLIQKGVTTRDEILQMFGEPHGLQCYPLIESQEDESLLYAYSRAHGSASHPRIFQMALTVNVNRQGIVTAVDYAESGEQSPED